MTGKSGFGLGTVRNLREKGRRHRKEVMFLALGQQNEFYSEIVCLGAAADHTYTEARCHAALCHTGKSSERTGNTVTSVFPCGVRLREGSGPRYRKEELAVAERCTFKKMGEY